MKGRFVVQTILEKRALPDQPSIEYLRKEAKRQLVQLRGRAASAQLADAQLLVARSYGFASWRSLKDEIDRRHEALGIRPPTLLGDSFHRPRRPAGRALVQDPVDAEQVFFRVVTFPFLAAPAAQAAGMLFLFLFG
jgi:hypothetical protein